MGAKESFQANLWQSKFEFDSKNSRVGMIKLSDRQTEDTYICRKICTVEKKEIFEIDRLIDLKLSIQSPYIVKLQKAQSQDNREYCSYGKNYYLLFKQPYQTLKQQTLNRKFKNSMYSESQLEMMLEVGVKALSFLKNIYHPHSNISSTSFFVIQNRSMILGDPFMFPKENSAVITRNGFIYPSPELIRFQNDQIQSYNEHSSDLFTLGLVLLQVFFMVNMDCVYERYFERVKHQAIWQKLKGIKSQDLKKKLFILLDPEPKNRQMIFKLYIKSIPSQQLYQQLSKQQFKKNIQRYNLATSQVTQWKNQFHFEQRVSSSEGKNTISVSTADHLHNDQKTYHYYERQYGRNLNPVQKKFNLQQNYPNNNYGQSNQNFQGTNRPKLINPNIQSLNAPINIDRRVISNSENIQNSQIRFNTPLNIQKPLISWYTTNYKYQPSSYRSGIGLPYNNQPVYTNYSNMATSSLKNQEFSKNYTSGLSNYTYGLSNYISDLPNNASSIPRTLQPSQKQYANDIKSNQALSAQIKSDIDFTIKTNYFSGSNFPEGNNQFVNNKSDQVQTEKNMNEPIKLISQSIKIQDHNQAKQIVMKPQIINLSVKQNSQTPGKSKKRRVSDYGKLHHLSTINQKSEMTDSFVSGQDDGRSQILIEEEVDVNVLSKSSCKNFKSSLQDQSETDQNRMWSIVYPSGTKYMGQMRNDKRNGVGTFFYIDGSKYHGDWLDNKMNGFGTLCYPNGKIAYEGEWRMDNFHGKGKVYNDEIVQFQGTYHYEDCEDIDQFWQDYQGQLFDDKREGRGVLRLSNKQYFDGRFKDDQMHGLCKFYRLDGQIIEGIWQNNKLVKFMSQKQ